jgi:chemotaxis signal transduction protein
METQAATRAADRDELAELHLIVRIKQLGLAIPTSLVREIAPIPRVVPIPNTAKHVRGVIDVRGEVVPMLDLRQRLGIPPRSAEVHEVEGTLRDRLKDHENWIGELEASVREKRPFTLTRDPHACKFGKWYDTYKPDIGALAFIWGGFDEPHKRIHALADEVTALVDRGAHELALQLVEKARATELKALVQLFNEAIQAVHVSDRELAIILRRGSENIAISVDAAESVETLSAEREADVPEEIAAHASDLTRRTVRRSEGDEILFMLEADRLFPGTQRAA